MKIGIDIGGTKIRVGIIGDNGEVLESRKAPCPSRLGKQEVVDFVAGMVSEVFSKDIDSIGIGVPAIVDDNGVICDCVNIPSWDRVDIKSDFEKRFGVPVSVRNDCNCYALGIKSTSLGCDFDDMVCITLGTGVGSGIIIDGKLYLGVSSCAGEIGEIPYKERNYEFYCSSQFFVSKGTTGKDAAIAAAEGDSKALELWKEFGENVADLISMAVFAYSPQAIFLGGSISEAYQYFEAVMRKRLSAFPYKDVIGRLKIVAATSPDIILAGAGA